MALTDLATVKTFMGIPAADTSLDALITLLIPAVSAELERYCGRHFEAADYKTLVWSEGGKYLYLPEYPIIQIRRFMISDWDVLLLENTSVDASEATVNVSQEQSKMYLNVYSGVNAGTEEIVLTGKTLTALAAAIVALGKGWTATVSSGYGNVDATELLPLLAAPALTPNRVYCKVPDENLEELSMIERTGRVELQIGAFPVRGFPLQRYIFVDYRTGYDSIPADLQMLVNKLIAYVARESTRDTSLKSEKLGDYQWTAADLSDGISSAFRRYEDDVLLWRRIAL